MKKEKAAGFNLLVPFSINKDAQEVEDTETIKISGIANFCGDLADDSSIEVDLAGEVVVPSGMDLSIYKGNPQILWQHDRDYSCGVCDTITKKKDGIYIEATIHKGAMEEEDWYRVKNGLITRFSIGFRCKGGEFKEINGRSVYFITKSLLLEISIVSIPASSSSAFSVVKSLTDEEGLYSGDIFSKSEDVQEETNTKIDTGDTMKLKLKEFLSEEEIARYKSLGFEARLEEDTDVELKTYVDAIIATSVAAALTSLKEEIVKELATTEVVEESSEKSEVEPEESTEEEAEEDVEGEKSDVEEVSAEDAEVIKSLTDTINQLRVLVEETK